MPTVSADGTTMHYVDVGSRGTPVLLLHAFPLHSGMWRPQLDALATDRRVVAPDLKGFGASDAPADPSAYSMAGYADDVAGLLSGLELDRVVVVGLSMGGYVAFSLLARHRPLVAGLVLADTRAGRDSDQVLERRSQQQRQVAEEGTAPVIDSLLETLLAEPTRERRPEVVAEVRRLMDNPPAGFVGGLEAMKRRPDATDALGAIDVPTLVVVGEHDKPSPPHVARAMHDQIAGSRYTVVPDAAHLTNLEASEAFNQALGDFLSEV